MTDQQAFDAVVAHARAQGRKARGPSPQDTRQPPGIACLYRAPDGAMCFVGCLIPDAEYSPQMEGNELPDLLAEFNPPALTGLDVDLLAELQGVHDRNEPDRWESEFAELAVEFGLTYTPPEVGTV